MISVATRLQSWELREPFETARNRITHLPVLLIELTGEKGLCGRAEAAGVDYDGETPTRMAAQIASVQAHLHAGVSGQDLLELLPAGGARNALDCALWDLRAKESGVPAASARPRAPSRPLSSTRSTGRWVMLSRAVAKGSRSSHLWSWVSIEIIGRAAPPRVALRPRAGDRTPAE